MSEITDADGTHQGGIAVGEELPPLTVRFTRADLVRYAGASTDFNPIHYSERFATQVGLPGVVAHGMLTMASALRVVTDWVGDPARVRSYFVRFTKPVVVPDDDRGAEVVFSATVTAIEGKVATIAINAICDGLKVLGAAKCEVDLAGADLNGADLGDPNPEDAKPEDPKPEGEQR